jgi:hypothetical protein
VSQTNNADLVLAGASLKFCDMTQQNNYYYKECDKQRQFTRNYFCRYFGKGHIYKFFSKICHLPKLKTFILQNK